MKCRGFRPEGKHRRLHSSIGSMRIRLALAALLCWTITVHASVGDPKNWAQWRGADSARPAARHDTRAAFFRRSEELGEVARPGHAGRVPHSQAADRMERDEEHQ